MATRSEQLLTEAASQAATRLKEMGWRQKDYLSAGVIALAHADEPHKAYYKALAVGAGSRKIEEIKVLFNSMIPEEKTQVLEALMEDATTADILARSKEHERAMRKKKASSASKSG